MMTLIAAIASNGVIGANGSMPWPRLSADLKRFKEITMSESRVCVMGRKTFDGIIAQIGKPLPGRKSIVLSRNTHAASFLYDEKDVQIVEALGRVGDLAARADSRSFCIGGGEIYRLCLPFCDTLELTRIHAEYQGDTFLNEINFTQHVLKRETFNAATETTPAFTFETWVRK